MADYILKKIPQLPEILNENLTINANVVVEQNGIASRTKAGNFKTEIADNLTTDTATTALSAKQGVELKRLNDWLAQSALILFSYDTSWTITASGSDLDISIPGGFIRLPNKSAYVCNATTGTLVSGGGIKLTYNSINNSYTYTFVSDTTLLTYVEGANDNEYIICKNIDGTIETYNSSLYEYINSEAEQVSFALSDLTTALTTGKKEGIHIPFDSDLDSLFIGVDDAPTGSTLIVDLKKNGTSIFSTKVSIDASETSSLTAATPYVLTGAISFIKGDYLTAHVDQIGAINTGKGLKCFLNLKHK